MEVEALTDTDTPAGSGRNETREEQLDRNWMELLQELRVLQTGVQILAGFLLTLPFQDRFATLDDFQTGLYLVDVALAALTTAFILLPVSVHRRLFRQRLKATLVTSADNITKIALSGVAALSVGTAALVFDVVAGRAAGIIAGLVLLAVLVLLLAYIPMHLHRQAKR
jgi:glucan phosphoethanolaminetransferase (alkaline phosphatase superfamily)